MTNSTFRRLLAHWRSYAAGAATIAAFLAITTLPAEARRHGHHFRHAAHHHSARHHAAFSHGHSGHADAGGDGAVTGEHSGFAAIVVDANNGRTLFARNENELRHPASVTKVMTLYLLFEQLEKGRLRLDSQLMISAHAAAQAPSKLGLRPGETIDVENAIKAVVTKSANDIACAIAENIGGDEAAFAQMMTRKAHALGMRQTHYANASGLPDPSQITTAHDLAVLGRAIQDRFPRYYRYFSIHSFAYNGGLHRNHNHLLGRVQGMDGIKTGYTRASGFNLLTSVRRGGRHIVAVVLGGRTGAARDRIMAGLIEENIGGGATIRTAQAITETSPAEPAIELAAERETERAPEALALAEVEPPPSFAHSDPVAIIEREPAAEPERKAAAIAERQDEAPAFTASIPTRRMARAKEARETAAAAAVAALAQPAPAASAQRVEKARPAFVSGVQKRVEEPVEHIEHKGRAKPREAAKQMARLASADGSTSRVAARSAHEGAAAATTPSALRHADANRTQIAKSDNKSDNKSETGRPARPGWMIQIGATGDVEEANQLLARARTHVQGMSAGAKGFTEKVQKGKETLYRARFAGLEERSAETACKALKRSGFSCFATKN